MLCLRSRSGLTANSPSSSSLLCGGSGPPGESGGMMLFGRTPRRSASLPDCGEGSVAYPPAVGRLGSLASNLALLPLLAELPGPDAPEDASDDMLDLRGRTGPPGLYSSPDSCGVAVRLGGFLSAANPAVGCRRARSSGYGRGRGPEGGGEVGAPYKAALLLGGTRYCAHCCCGSSDAWALAAAPPLGCLLMRNGGGVSVGLAAEASGLRNSS